MGVDLGRADQNKIYERLNAYVCLYNIYVYIHKELEITFLRVGRSLSQASKENHTKPPFTSL